MPTDLADQCKAYHAKIEQFIDNLLKINQELQAELAELKTKSAEPESVKHLLDLLEVDFAKVEDYTDNGPNLTERIALFREIRPKKQSND